LYSRNIKADWLNPDIVELERLLTLLNVEVASALLLQAGQPGEAIRTERFGPTGA
jgi:hypothetical protein